MAVNLMERRSNFHCSLPFPVGSACCCAALTTVCPSGSEREQSCSTVHVKLLPLSRTEEAETDRSKNENEKPGLSEFRKLGKEISTSLSKSFFTTLMSVIFLHEIGSITRRNPLWVLLFMLQKHDEAFRDLNLLSD